MMQKILLLIVCNLFLGWAINDDFTCQFGINRGGGQFGLEHELLCGVVLHLTEVYFVALGLGSLMVRLVTHLLLNTNKYTNTIYLSHTQCWYDMSLWIYYWIFLREWMGKGLLITIWPCASCWFQLDLSFRIYRTRSSNVWNQSLWSWGYPA